MLMQDRRGRAAILRAIVDTGVSMMSEETGSPIWKVIGSEHSDGRGRADAGQTRRSTCLPRLSRIRPPKAISKSATAVGTKPGPIAVTLP
jgi:hypothetical protein